MSSSVLLHTDKLSIQFWVPLRIFASHWVITSGGYKEPPGLALTACIREDSFFYMPNLLLSCKVKTENLILTLQCRAFSNWAITISGFTQLWYEWNMNLRYPYHGTKALTTELPRLLSYTHTRGVFPNTGVEIIEVYTQKSCTQLRKRKQDILLICLNTLATYKN
jgi:hypothetical protein